MFIPHKNQVKLVKFGSEPFWSNPRKGKLLLLCSELIESFINAFLLISIMLLKAYQKALGDEKQRQPFLDLITEQGIPKYVKKIIYQDEDKGKDIYRSLMGVVCNPLALLHIPKTSSTIKVYPFSFSGQIHCNLDDFLSTLKDHEYFHAREHYFTPNNIGYSIAANIYLRLRKFGVDYHFSNEMWIQAAEQELRACNNQIETFPERNCSDKFRKWVFDRRRDNEREIESQLSLIAKRKKEE